MGLSGKPAVNHSSNTISAKKSENISMTASS